nr:MAG TPA_asm: TRAF PROTEIN, TRAO PROTEIN, TRAN ADHESION, BACTERIAL SECRETION.5A [Caudoviricetes sp.]
MKTIFFLCCLLTVGCCSCRRTPVIVERRIYVHDPLPDSYPHWIPKTHRDSVLWKASQAARQSATESTKHLNPLYQ